MGYDCCLLASDGGCDDVDYSQEGFRVARKPHVCCECGRTMQPGDTYHLIEQVTRGEGWVRFKTCKTCAHMRERFSCGEGYHIGIMRQTLKEALGIDYVTNEIVATATGNEPWAEECMKRYRELGPEA